MTSAVESKRAQLKRRIEEMNKQHCATGKELQACLDRLVVDNVAYLRAALVKIVLEEFANLVRQTPVETGRARAGWQIGPEATEWKPPLRKKTLNAVEHSVADVLQQVQDPTRLTEADVIHITNNVEYILALEAGWSKQAPNGFIGLFMQRLTQRLRELAAYGQ